MESNFAVEFVVSLCVLIEPVEYSMVRKVFKTCQMTFNLHFDEKIITIGCVVLKICAFEISEKNALFRVNAPISRSSVNRGGPHGFTPFSVQKNLISHF